MTEKKKIALLFFSRTAALEGRKKAWFAVGAGQKNKALAASLIRHTQRVLQQSGFPVFHYHEGNQRGATFGERIAQAYQDVFDLGYDAVIALGNDTPEIDRINWKQVGQQLAAGKCVIGPTFRQGAYLIGMTAEVFKKEAFQELPWQSGRLLEALRQFCIVPDGATIVLTTLRDINARPDIRKVLLHSFLDIHLKRIMLLLFFFQTLIRFDRIPAFAPKLYLLGHAHFRAPPSGLIVTRSNAA